jgi:hypothetical protein
MKYILVATFFLSVHFSGLLAIRSTTSKIDPFISQMRIFINHYLLSTKIIVTTTEDLTQFEQKHLAMDLWANGRKVQFKSDLKNAAEIHENCHFLAFIKSNQTLAKMTTFLELYHEIGLKSVSLIFLDKLEFLDNFQLQINQEIYFVIMMEQKWTIFESYVVNNIKIRQPMGQLSNTLVFESFEKLSFLERRSNFWGQKLIVMTESEPPFIMLDPEFVSKSTFHKENETYDVTNNNVVSGMFYDILQIMSIKLNFTFSLYKRKDGNWGSIYEGLHNGTIIGSTGMIHSIINGQADMIGSR